MCAQFKGNPCSKTVSSYSPTNTSDEIDMTPYNKFSSLVRYISIYNVRNISGYMNDQIRKDENNKFCPQNFQKRN